MKIWLAFDYFYDDFLTLILIKLNVTRVLTFDLYLLCIYINIVVFLWFIGDELLSDSFSYKKILGGALWEVSGKWYVKEDYVNIGANPSAEVFCEHERLDDKRTRVVDIIDAFRLKFCTYFKSYTKALIAKLDDEPKYKFMKDIRAATKYLLDIPDLKFFAGESMKDDATMVFGYYKKGARDPTFLYLPHALMEVKCEKKRES
ncbi:Translationally-controlled tumor protein homolog [Linum grandiflorum]